MFKKGVYNLTKDDKVHINIDKAVNAGKDMLTEIIRVQIDDDFNKGEKYVLDNFVWTNEMEIIGQKLQKLNTQLNGRLECTLADKLLKE